MGVLFLRERLMRSLKGQFYVHASLHRRELQRNMTEGEGLTPNTIVADFLQTESDDFKELTRLRQLVRCLWWYSAFHWVWKALLIFAGLANH